MSAHPGHEGSSPRPRPRPGKRNQRQLSSRSRRADKTQKPPSCRLDHQIRFLKDHAECHAVQVQHTPCVSLSGTRSAHRTHHPPRGSRRRSQDGAEAIKQAMAFYASIRKKPIQLRKELPGPCGQPPASSGSIREMLYLIRQGVLSVDDTDVAVFPRTGTPLSRHGRATAMASRRRRRRRSSISWIT